MVQHILVIGPPALAHLFPQLLQPEGYRVHCVVSGQAARAHHRKHPVDLVLLDRDVPDLLSMRIIEYFKGEQGVPVLLLAAGKAPRDLPLPLHQLIDGYVDKPVRLRVFFRQLQACLTPVPPPEEIPPLLELPPPAPPESLDAEDVVINLIRSDLQKLRHELVGDETNSAPEASNTRGQPRTPANILVVDDDPNTLRLLDIALSRAGYQTILAADGRAALTALEQHTPDLVICDLILPEIGGAEVCEQMQRHPVQQRIPIIVISALVRGLQRLSFPYHTYLEKPFTVQRLLASVQQVLPTQTMADANGL